MGFGSRTTNGVTHRWPRIQVCITNSKVEALRSIQKTFNKGNVYINHHSGFKNGKDSGQWRITKREEVQWFMDAVSPFCIFKAHELKLCRKALSVINDKLTFENIAKETAKLKSKRPYSRVNELTAVMICQH